MPQVQLPPKIQTALAPQPSPSVPLPGGIDTTPTTQDIQDDPPVVSTPTNESTAAFPIMPTALTLWLPAEFDPNNGSKAGNLLKARIEAFEEQFGAQVQVRLKDSSGPGGLIESLQAAGEAAPMAMPSVIALPRADLETAAIKGLLVPLDGLSTVIDEVDWYAYARQLSMVQGTTFSLPFAGDALIVVYRPAKVIAPPVDWDAAFRLGQPMAFPAGDAQALFTLDLYQSLGGLVEDSQRRPQLDVDILASALQLVADGEERGLFPVWLTQFESYDQAWQAYQDERVNVAVAWSSVYLRSKPVDSAALALPTPGKSSASIATGWGWAVADPISDRRALAARLVEYLSDGNFLAQWTEAAGFLPTRPSSQAAWRDGDLKTLISPILAAAYARPSNDLLASHGPALKEAMLSLLKQEATPLQAAQTAADRLNPPANR